MGLFSKKATEPEFLKESSNALQELEVLKALESKLNSDGRQILKQKIRNLEAGIEGENRIAFELKNSHMPIVVLHDIYLEDGDLSAQIDYMVFTDKLCFVIESKNLYGNIEIDRDGNFIREMKYGSKTVKERIYSPITQNERHFQLIKKRIRDNQNFLVRLFSDKAIDNAYIPIVVLANPKSVLNMKYAPKAIKGQVIYVDQLIAFIKKKNNESDQLEYSFEETKRWAKNYLDAHKEVEKNYIGWAEKYFDTEQSEEVKNISETKAYDPEEMKKRLEGTKVYTALKEWRTATARAENIKPYYIFNDAQLVDLLMKNPKRPEDLLQVNGFGAVKVEKYGTQILNILDQFRK